MTKNKPNPVERRLLKSMKQAVAIRRGHEQASRVYDLQLTARSAAVAPAPHFTKGDIAELRSRLNLSQQVFADALNVSLGTVRSWEQGARVPEGPSVRLLEIARKHPAIVLGAILLQPGGRSVYPSPDRVAANPRVNERPRGRKR